LRKQPALFACAMVAQRRWRGAMTACRHLFLQRQFASAILSLMLLARLLVPAGWMPALQADGIRLELCADSGPVSPAMALALQDAERRLAGDDGDTHQQRGADESCAYAASAFTLPPLAEPLAWSPDRQPPQATLVLASIGQGLAAPPPPATGPPALI
jgi:hypothetical protein